MIHAQLYDVDYCIECASNKKIIKGNKKFHVGQVAFSLCNKHSASLSTIARTEWNEPRRQCKKCGKFHPETVSCDDEMVGE